MLSMIEFYTCDSTQSMIKHEFGDCSSKPLGHHTLGIECKSVLSTGVDRMLVGNRVGVGLSRSTISYFASFLKKAALMAVSPL